MEMSDIVHSLEDKSILITGSTGFLAKLFVEKMLRVQPKVKKLFLLVRANDATSARRRVEDEIASKELFKLLKEKYKESFNLFFWSKVTVVVGDTTSENLGIRDADLINVLWREIDFIVHSAATTRFNERYDVALNINTFGARNIMLFAKNCARLQMLLHISTAYVTKEKEGIITEKLMESDELLLPKAEKEAELIEKKMKELKNACASNKTIMFFMKELGMKRANKFGWPNVYSFTKAMGELQAAKLKGSFPVAILRPTIILSTYKEPFPGWIEGVRTMDKIIISYANGEIACIPANLDATMDVIPGDMVVNAMFASMTSDYDPNLIPIYHVGSSSKNILRFNMISDTTYKYFSIHPFTTKDGQLITVRKPFFFSNMFPFFIYMVFIYKLPIKVLLIVATLLCSQRLKNQYNKHNQAFNNIMLMVKAYNPYTHMLGRFDDTNTEILRMKMNRKDMEMFSFDPKPINWVQFLMDIHIPGLIKYGLN
ncbi:fatty acyl-CoA reductase protein [Dioscorea alata]|uniref:Fatty acyl-CoA reductase protein n=1 Tax=Dioscorea alata TaxID=55571 RepID=A0ACB7WM26_DIOAL|nr:fatty acyl-CoA reductase protein [Dioscorea alata]